CLGWAVEREILQRNGAAARALLASLPAPRPDLELRVRELERELEAARAREVENERKERDMDASVSATPRVVFFTVFAAIGIALSVATYLDEQRTGQPASMKQQVGLDVALLVLLTVGLL